MNDIMNWVNTTELGACWFGIGVTLFAAGILSLCFCGYFAIFGPTPSDRRAASRFFLASIPAIPIIALAWPLVLVLVFLVAFVFIVRNAIKEPA